MRSRALKDEMDVPFRMPVELGMPGQASGVFDQRGQVRYPSVP